MSLRTATVQGLDFKYWLFCLVPGQSWSEVCLNRAEAAAPGAVGAFLVFFSVLNLFKGL